MPGIEVIRWLLQQATAQGSRSTALNPIAWAFAVILSAVVASVWVHSPNWLIILFSVFAALILVVFLFAYIYFALTNSDALRSEKFTLSKMAIERSVTGDTLRGFLEPSTANAALEAKVEPTSDQRT